MYVSSRCMHREMRRRQSKLQKSNLKKRNLERIRLQRSHLGKREGFRNFHHSLLRWRKTFKKGKWFTDEHIHLAQTLLRAQFPNINGLQCPLLSENDAFDAQPHEALQIHFVAGNHWVASSSFGQEVTVYDSKYSGKLHPSLTHQLARIYRSLQTDEDGDLMQRRVPFVQIRPKKTEPALTALRCSVQLIE